MTKTVHQALQQALEFVEFCWRDVSLNDYAEEKRAALEAVLEAALEQPVPDAVPVDDPHAYSRRCAAAEFQRGAWGKYAALEQATGKNPLQVEQQEQGAVAWANMKGDGNPALLSISQHPEDRANWTNPVPLYTHPPRRPWQGLTAEEIIDAVRESDLDWQQGWTLEDGEPNRYTQLARAIEAALEAYQPKNWRWCPHCFRDAAKRGHTPFCPAVAFAKE